MKNNKNITTSLILVPLLAIILAACSGTASEQAEVETARDSTSLIFPKGNLGPASNFTGAAHNYGLVPGDSIYNILAGNVYFERGARSNWHTHPGGQVLIILDGEGYHQIEGQPRQTMRKGDVIQCPPNAKHWHGASENSSLSQMYIVTNIERGIVNWMEPVTDEQYNTN